MGCSASARPAGASRASEGRSCLTDVEPANWLSCSPPASPQHHLGTPSARTEPRSLSPRTTLREMAADSRFDSVLVRTLELYTFPPAGMHKVDGEVPWHMVVEILGETEALRRAAAHSQQPDGTSPFSPGIIPKRVAPLSHSLDGPSSSPRASTRPHSPRTGDGSDSPPEMTLGCVDSSCADSSSSRMGPLAVCASEAVHSRAPHQPLALDSPRRNGFVSRPVFKQGWNDDGLSEFLRDDTGVSRETYNNTSFGTAFYASLDH
eukprot:TRINITY_DN4157_c0_g1_i1.p1 TRINITY_DN4157_c0_g1~~TRINITY_DN4157_c0_g1_i1.p1  ORF type:complete len:263 (+),score=24.80 TRINITY_DN4157_c0_g1_i1:112-900(+)